MTYTENFKKAVELAAKNIKFYLGTGNPDAKILIVGKELGFENQEQAEREVTNNIPQWEENIRKNFSIEDIKCYSETEVYNPLFPYKGQIAKKDNEKNNGTSVTWLNYQKLHDDIYCAKSKTKEINFHKDFFLTEINQPPSKSSKEQDKDKRKESIECRKKFIHDSDFFQSFPITILTCKAYISDPQELFVNKLLGGEEVLKIARNPCKIYFSEDKKKIVILTRQLSNSFKKELLEKISSEIQVFIKGQSKT